VPLLERLRARLGDDAVGTLVARDDHRPERAGCESAMTTMEQAAPRPATPGPPRPLWLLDAPRALRDALEAKPWVLRDGPERIESGWWDGGDCRRDYFVAENHDGEIVWIYRDHRDGTDDGEWFMHGLFA
jgi:protein ImuB